MINSCRRILDSSINFFPDTVPSEIDFPDIGNGFGAGVAAVEDDVGFEVGHDVAVAGSRGGAFAVFDLPVGFVGYC